MTVPESLLLLILVGVVLSVVLVVRLYYSKIEDQRKLCPACGEPNPADTDRCSSCGFTFRTPSKRRSL